jgi:polyketide cyclase/dehydrase/lipid transport protein
MSKPARARNGTIAPMASIVREIRIDADPDHVWAALRDWGAVHRRLAPGFVTDTRLDGGDRIVTFFNGTVLREVLVGRDDAQRRLVWQIVDGPYTHHNGSAQVFADAGATRFVWISDLLPEELAGRTAEAMERGLGVIKATMESAANDRVASARPAGFP